VTRGALCVPAMPTMPTRIVAMTPPGSRPALARKGPALRAGPVGAWLNRREFDAVRRHMREEGQNVKRLLESGA
jgi:hypothetical protein